jgi:hypothetical protein
MIWEDTSQQQQRDESQGRKACFLQDEFSLTSVITAAVS